jgi:hypothetical protein
MFRIVRSSCARIALSADASQIQSCMETVCIADKQSPEIAQSLLQMFSDGLMGKCSMTGSVAFQKDVRFEATLYRLLLGILSPFGSLG